MVTQAIKVRIDEKTNKVLTNKLNKVNSGDMVTPDNILRTLKFNFEEAKIGAHDTRKVKKINQYAYTFPNFYKKEYKNSFIWFILWMLFFAITLVGISLAIWQVVVNSEIANWIVVFLLVPFFVVGTLTAIYIDRYYCFRTEAKTISFKETKTVSMNIIKLYKRLRTGHINCNWLCGLVYVLSVLLFLTNALVFWLLNNSANYDILTIFFPISGLSDMTQGVISLIASGCFIVAVISHCVILLANYIRINRIDCYYGVEIVPSEEITLLKKKKNRRDMIVFLVCCVLIGIIVWLVIKLVKRRKPAPTTVLVK